MKGPRRPTTMPIKPLGRRGGVRGTGAASGSPPSIESGLTRDFRASSKREYGGLPPALDESPLLEAPEVARLLGIGRTKVYELIAKRELPVLCIGRCVRVPRAQLQQWIASHTEMAARQ